MTIRAREACLRVLPRMEFPRARHGDLFENIELFEGGCVRREIRESIHNRARELMKSEGLLWPAALAKADTESRCGARCRSRGWAPCRARKMPGKQGCRMHFGNLGPWTPEMKEAASQRAFARYRINGRFAKVPAGGSA